MRIATILLVLLAGCGGQPNHQTQMHDIPIIDPSDPLTIKTWEHSEYNFDHSKIVVHELSYFHGKLGDGALKESSAVAIEVCDALNAGITESQNSAIDELIRNEGSVMATVRNAIYQYYEEAYPDYKRGMDMGVKIWGGADQVKKMLPEIMEGDEIDGLVTIDTISIHPPIGDDVMIGIDFTVEWDEEHGMGLRMLDGEIEAIGTAHESYPPQNVNGE